MAKSFKDMLVHSLRIRESWVIFFVLGIIMMNFPFLSIFNKPDYILNLPLLYLYLQLGWVCSICVIFIFTKANHFNGEDKKQKGEHD